MARSGTNGRTMVPKRILGFREKLLRPIRDTRFAIAPPDHHSLDVASVFGSDRHLQLEQRYVSARSPHQRVHWSTGRDNYTDMDGNIYLSLQLPSEDAPVEDKILCLRGVRVHETLHTLRTDKKAFRRFVRKEMPELQQKFGPEKAQQIKTLWNIVEDGMIERWEQRYNPEGFEFIKTLNLIDPRVGREWAVEAEHSGQAEVRVPWHRDYAPVDIDGNELEVVFDANGDPQEVVIPVGTRFSQWSDRPIVSLQSQAILAIQAEALPMFEPGALHPDVQAMLDEARPYIDTAVNGDTNACIDAAYALESILRSHDMLPPEVRYDQNTGTSSVVDQDSQGAQAPTITVSAPSSLDFDDPNAQKGMSGKKGKQGDEDEDDDSDGSGSSGPRRENDLRNQMGENAPQPGQQQPQQQAGNQNGQQAQSNQSAAGPQSPAGTPQPGQGQSGESGDPQAGDGSQPGESGEGQSGEGQGQSGGEGGESGEGSDAGSSPGSGGGSSSSASGGQPGGNDGADGGAAGEGEAGENSGAGASGKGSQSGSGSSGGGDDTPGDESKDGTAGGKGKAGQGNDGSGDGDGDGDADSGKSKGGKGKGAGADGDDTGEDGDESGSGDGKSGKGNGADGEGDDDADADGDGSGAGGKGKADDGEAKQQDGVRDSGGADGDGTSDGGGQGAGGKKGNPAMGDQNSNPFGGGEDGMNGPNNKKGQQSGGGKQSSGNEQSNGGSSSGGQQAGGGDSSQSASAASESGPAGSDGGGSPTSSSNAKPQGAAEGEQVPTQGGGGTGGANLRDPDAEILYDPKKKEAALEKARQGVREQMRAQAVQDKEKEKRQEGRGYYNWRAPGNHHIIRQREIRPTVSKPVKPSPGVQRAANKIAKELERLRNEEAAAQRYLRQGRYDKRAGVRARAGSENVMMRPGTMTEATMEMEVLIDLSGSTNDMRDHIFEMATAFKLAGKQTKIPTSIWGYDGDEGYRHDHGGDATHYELASPDSDDMRALTKILEKTGSGHYKEPVIGGGGTPTASAIEFARTRLAHSTADKKLIVLVTDGGSNNADACREQVRYAKGDDIAFLTCGFADDGRIENNKQLSAAQKKEMREQLEEQMAHVFDAHIGPGNWVAVQNYMEAPIAAGRKIIEMKRAKQRAR